MLAAAPVRGGHHLAAATSYLGKSEPFLVASEQEGGSSVLGHQDEQVGLSGHCLPTPSFTL